MASPVPLLQGLRKRSGLACLACRMRKTRCDVSVAGSPCSKCRKDSLICEVKGKGRNNARSQQRKDREFQTSTLIHTETESSEQHTFCATVHAAHPLPSLPQTWSRDAGPGATCASDISGRDKGLSATPKQRESPYPGDADAHEAEETLVLEAAINGSVQSPDYSPFYLGDQQGLSFLLDSCNSTSVQRGGHYLIPHRAASPLHQDDVAHLRKKGAFSLPRRDICDVLIQHYFQYIHPILPLLDASSFIQTYSRNGPEDMPLMLLWCMFSVASNFASPETVQAAGYTSRKEMKQEMYHRAKLLYDVDYDGDKIATIQSLVLLSFRGSVTEDKTGARYWINSAISLAEALGLYRKPNLPISDRNTKERHLRLWRRIWWSCFLQDRLLSFCTGRPMRINMDDCDVPLPEPSDVVSELREIPAAEKQKYFLSEDSALTNFWIQLIRLSVVLGKILSVSQRWKVQSQAPTEIEALYREILGYSPGNQANQIGPPSTGSGIFKLHIYQYQILYEATIIALFRPYALSNNFQETGGSSAEIREMARRRAKDAAERTTAILRNIVAIDMIHVFGPTVVTALTPAICIHLSGLEGVNPVARKLGLLELQVYETIFKELQRTWASARLVYKLLNAVMLRLRDAEGVAGAATKHVSAHPHIDFQDHIKTPTILDEALPVTGSFESNSPQALVTTDLWGGFDVTFNEFWNEYNLDN